MMILVKKNGKVYATDKGKEHEVIRIIKSDKGVVAITKDHEIRHTGKLRDLIDLSKDMKRYPRPWVEMVDGEKTLRIPKLDLDLSILEVSCHHHHLPHTLTVREFMDAYFEENDTLDEDEFWGQFVTKFVLGKFSLVLWQLDRRLELFREDTTFKDYWSNMTAEGQTPRIPSSDKNRVTPTPKKKKEKKMSRKRKQTKQAAADMKKDLTLPPLPFRAVCRKINGDQVEILVSQSQDSPNHVFLQGSGLTDGGELWTKVSLLKALKDGFLLVLKDQIIVHEFSMQVTSMVNQSLIPVRVEIRLPVQWSVPVFEVRLLEDLLRRYYLPPESVLVFDEELWASWLEHCTTIGKIPKDQWIRIGMDIVFAAIPQKPPQASPLAPYLDNEPVALPTTLQGLKDALLAGKTIALPTGMPSALAAQVGNLIMDWGNIPAGEWDKQIRKLLGW